jgi:hypothetical protein
VKKKPKKPATGRKRAGNKAGKKPGTTLTKQPHGGAIHQGPAANVVPGPGRPPSAIRAALAASFDQRRPIYEEIADGMAVERIEVELEEVAGLIVCEGCGAGFVPKKDTPVDRMTIRAWRSSRVRDRLRAMDSMGRMGVGVVTAHEVMDIRQHPEAQRFMNAYHKALTEGLSAQVAEGIIKRVDELLQVAEPAQS